MVKFSLFIHENSDTSELLKGISTSKNTYINKIFPYKTDDNDKLLIYSLMKAEDDDVIIILNNNLSSKFTSKQILDYLEYVNDNLQKLDTEKPEEWYELDQNLFVDARLAPIVKANLNDSINQLNDIQLKLEKLKYYYKNLEG